MKSERKPKSRGSQTAAHQGALVAGPGEGERPGLRCAGVRSGCMDMSKKQSPHENPLATAHLENGALE